MTAEVSGTGHAEEAVDWNQAAENDADDDAAAENHDDAEKEDGTEYDDCTEDDDYTDCDYVAGTAKHNDVEKLQAD